MVIVWRRGSRKEHTPEERKIKRQSKILWKYGSINDLEPSIYNATQMKIVALGRGRITFRKDYHDFSDLDTEKYSYEQRILIAKIRENSKHFGSIDDLEPKKYNIEQMKAISEGRGKKRKFGNIDDLVPVEHSAEVMKAKSIGRGSSKKYWNIDDIEGHHTYDSIMKISKARREGLIPRRWRSHIKKSTISEAERKFFKRWKWSKKYGPINHINVKHEQFNEDTLRIFSLARGCNKKYGAIMDLENKKWPAVVFKWISIGRGIKRRYGNIDNLSFDKIIYKNGRLLLNREIARRLKNECIKLGTNRKYGNVDDLDPSKFSAQQMEIVSLSRGANSKYGSLEELKPVKNKKIVHKWDESLWTTPPKFALDGYDVSQLEAISLARGSNLNYGNIDELPPHKWTGKQMLQVSLGRGKNSIYGNINDIDPDLWSAKQMKQVSLGRGNDMKYGKIDRLNPKKYNGAQMKRISLGRGDLSCWTNIDDLNPDKYTAVDMRRTSNRNRNEKNSVSGEKFNTSNDSTTQKHSNGEV